MRQLHSRQLWPLGSSSHRLLCRWVGSRDSRPRSIDHERVEPRTVRVSGRSSACCCRISIREVQHDRRWNTLRFRVGDEQGTRLAHRRRLGPNPDCVPGLGNRSCPHCSTIGSGVDPRIPPRRWPLATTVGNAPPTPRRGTDLTPHGLCSTRSRGSCEAPSRWNRMRSRLRCSRTVTSQIGVAHRWVCIGRWHR